MSTILFMFSLLLSAGSDEHSDRFNKDVPLQLCLVDAGVSVYSSSHTKTPPTIYDFIAQECKRHAVIYMYMYSWMLHHTLSLFYNNDN